MYMRKTIYIILLFFSLLASCNEKGGAAGSVVCADSLSALLDEYRYGDVEKLRLTAERLVALNIDDEYNSVATASLAYSALMRMDYKKAEALYLSVKQMSHSEIERLVADVGLMTLCYRVSANRAFFDYRASALERVRRIEEEAALLSQPARERFARAKVELGVVSLCYFSGIGLLDEMLLARGYLARELEECNDVALRLYARMMLLSFETDVLRKAEGYAFGAGVAADKGFVWLSANYKLLLAITLRGKGAEGLFAGATPSLIALFNKENLPVEEYAFRLAGDAVCFFEQYGDDYMRIEALAVEASCLIGQGRYSEALALLDKAVDGVNVYYKKYCEGVPALSLTSFSLSDSDVEPLSQDGSQVDIPECLLSIRREASCAYAGLGDKNLSDINREAYLALLRTTRMNKEVESRVLFATEAARRLYWLSMLAVTALLLMAVLLYMMGRKRRKADEEYSLSLKRLLNLSRSLFSSLPSGLASEEEVCDAVCGILSEGFEGFNGRLRFSLKAPFEACEDYPFVYDFPLPFVADAKSYTLYISSSVNIDAGWLSVVEMALPYVSVAMEEGLRIADILDEQSFLEEQRLSHEIYLAEYKRENMLKRVSVSVVNGMRPYMDRMLNELRHLVREDNPSLAERRLQYVAELADKLSDYNLILERWIKMRRGALELQVERFAVCEVFDIIEKSVPSFEARGILLDVKKSDAVVRADRALTLFMVNTLVDNAGKFTPAGGTIVVEACEGDGFVELAVSDSGVGLSQKDIDVLLGEKVYDASLVGDADDPSSKNKGGGFGLMNCRGIIEKYRKTDEIFSVCSMNIESRKGVGSRFSFRLPSGMVRCALVLLSLLGSLSAFGNEALLERVTCCADSVYLSNIEGNYDAAYDYAAQAIGMLNEYYRESVGGVDTLLLRGDTSAELVWWREGLFPLRLKEELFFNILDVRNELAVAALATRRWDDYRYNNNIYASLYRLVHEDRGLDAYCEEMSRAANYRQAAIALLFFFMFLMLVTYMVSYVRHGVIGRMNSRVLLNLNRRLLAVTGGEEQPSAAELVDAVLSKIYTSLGEGMCVERVSLLLKYNDKETTSATFPHSVDSVVNDIYMRDVYKSGKPCVAEEGRLVVQPLSVVTSAGKQIIGALEFASGRSFGNSEILNLELIARYAAVVVHHSMVRLGKHYKELAMMEEATERVKFEEHSLHVRNLVLDNCLSVIKHETLYYPVRIKALTEQIISDVNNPEPRTERLAAMCELMEYYISIYEILSNCATKQLDDVNISCSQVALNEEFEAMRRFVERKAKRAHQPCVVLLPEQTTLSVLCDATLLRYLLELLLDASMAVKKEGELLLRAIDCGDVVRVELLDKRLSLSKDELSLMFVPSRDNIAADGGLRGMEYLVAKEIVRLHDDSLVQRGGRLEARAGDEGVVILFTLPKTESV